MNDIYDIFSAGDSLSLGGSLYVGGLDLTAPLRPPPQLWTAALRRGFVGCLKGEAAIKSL